MVFKEGFFKEKGNSFYKGKPFCWGIDMRIGDDYIILKKNKFIAGNMIVEGEPVSPEVLLEDFIPRDEEARDIVRKLEEINFEEYNIN